jgi:TonB-dependent outer membrane receptor, SusC/RagA subfamily, signature region
MKKLLAWASMLCLSLLVITSTTAQRTISGVITDELGEALIGANILELGTSNGTISDIDGSYTLRVSDGASIVISYTGFREQVIPIGDQTTINVNLAAGELLEEVVVTGYGSQRSKEITSAVERITEEEFNKGPISDPAQLLQGKVAGLQIYNRGGNPNASSTIRLRGLSTVGANTQPLIVIDGIIGASLDNVDPNDIAEINVLKDGSAAAIYGSRGSSGVILVTTKKGEEGKVQVSYNGQISTESPFNTIQVQSPEQFVQTGGTDLGSQTDWLDEVTRPGFSHLHNFSVAGGSGSTSYRISANVRNVEGILRNTGFDQFNTRLSLNTRVLNDRLKIGFTTSFTERESRFGFDEAFRYAVIYNPTAPIFGDDAPFAFNSPQFGGFFETLGLFDSFNPLSIIEQNTNEGERREFNYSANLDYSLTDNFSVTGRIAQQNTSNDNREFYPVTSLFRGGATSPTRSGLANLFSDEASFDLYEVFGTYTGSFGNAGLTLTGGYSFQENNSFNNFLSIGDFPTDDLDFINAIEVAQDLNSAGFIDANSNAIENDRIIAQFLRANLTLNDGIFVNASIRREGASRLGADNRIGFFPSFGVGVDLNNYLDLPGVDLFKIRAGFGVTGALPGQVGLSQEVRQINNAADGSVTTQLLRAANPDLKWEEKNETNIGVEFASGKFSATLDVYNRTIEDFILERIVDVAVFGVDRRVENAGQLSTNGVELGLNYDVFSEQNFTWSTGIVASTYTTNLDEFVVDASVRANLGAPGQNGTNVIRVQVGSEIGTIWGPVFEGVNDDGTARLADLNGDGVLNTGQGQALDGDADFTELGNGIPDLELGWTNTLNISGWTVNAFFRGAFGHSLVNTFRAFYEPIISSQTSYNFVNTSLAEPNLTQARFSSLYVEKADFFRLDNLTVGRTFNLSNDSGISSVGLSLNVRNVFTITSYTGTDPEPSLVDRGSTDNGNTQAINGDVLSPGLDRRNNYFAARAFTLGVNLNF